MGDWTSAEHRAKALWHKQQGEAHGNRIFKVKKGEMGRHSEASRAHFNAAGWHDIAATHLDVGHPDAARSSQRAKQMSYNATIGEPLLP